MRCRSFAICMECIHGDAAGHAVAWTGIQMHARTMRLKKELFGCSLVTVLFRWFQKLPVSKTNLGTLARLLYSRCWNGEFHFYMGQSRQHIQQWHPRTDHTAFQAGAAPHESPRAPDSWSVGAKTRVGVSKSKRKNTSKSKTHTHTQAGKQWEQTKK